ncbi:glycoside hydrolase family 2 protein [Puteibacter caeruleilacunae]|nr:glycoside hydrolase family 2 protein [Puteibacter caeruleilacunae]
MKLYSFLILICATMITFSCSTKDQPLVSKISLNDGWSFAENGTDQWLQAKVPGCVHTDLLRNGKIEDPFYRLNEHDVQWVDKKDWVYKKAITIDKQTLKKDRIIINFKGLDTYADVFINETKVLEADNMFRAWVVDAKPYLKEGENVLKILFHSPIKVGLDKYDNYPHVVHSSANDLAEIGQVPGNKWVSPHVRKAQCHFGWDWGPRLVTSGIWQDVTLEAWNMSRMQDLFIRQDKITKENAAITAIFEIDAQKEQTATLDLQVNEKVEATQQVQLKKGTHTYEIKLNIANPELWWTNGLGEATLYQFTGKLKTDAGKDSISHQVGLRDVKIIREKDKDGKCLYVKLNGIPVFMKGANYIPADAFLDRVTPEKYEKIVKTAYDCNHNMLRVWGGGIYEKEIFYDLCDKYGILVWQDFMFACNMYPGHPEFLQSVKEEAEYNVKRLRNHPSIALWCGNNEVLAAWKAWGWEKEVAKEDPEGAKAQWKAYKDIFLDVLPAAVAKYDAQKFYWPSSPQANDTTVNVYNEGDNHYWGVWWGKDPFSKYHTELSRFMSEYGFQSFPEFRTVKKYTKEEDWDIYSEVMKSHQRSSIGNGTIELYMLRDYKKPKDFESFLYVGQVLQAEGMRQGMEGHRIAMPYNMGSLYWQINDCWPVASWSSTDYYVNWKAMQYFSKKAFAEVLVAPRVEDKFFKVHVVSDRLKPIKGQLNLKLIDFNGRVVWEKAVMAEIPANSSQSYFDIDKYDFLRGKDSKKLLLKAELMENGKKIADNIYYFRPVKDLKLPKPQIETKVVKSENGYKITVSTDKLAKNIYFWIDGIEGFFSDNYFDVLPGQSTEIEFQTKETIEDFAGKLKTITITDTY